MRGVFWMLHLARHAIGESDQGDGCYGVPVCGEIFGCNVDYADSFQDFLRNIFKPRLCVKAPSKPLEVFLADNVVDSGCQVLDHLPPVLHRSNRCIHFDSG